MEILIFCGIYLVELVCYLVVLRMLFDVRVRTKVWMAVGILVPVVVGGVAMSAAGKNVLIIISVLSVMFLSIEDGVMEKGVWLVLTFLLLECVDSIFVRFCENLFVFISNNYIQNRSYLVAKCGTIICLFLINIVKEKMVRYKGTHIHSVIYFIVGIIVLLMMLCLEMVNQTIIYLQDKRYIILYNFLNVTICISIFFLIVFVIYIKNTHERMEKLLKTEQILKESQVNYYKQILKKEIDTRKYRHDMVSHLIYVQDVLSRERINDAQTYLTHILGGFKKIQNTYYVSGNEMVDAIMNYYFSMLPKEVGIDIKGKCPVEIDIEDTDICTIFSNLFQNAVEEIIEYKINDAWIMIDIQKGKRYVEYTIKNAVHNEANENYKYKRGLPKTHKSDKDNHGIGMINVRETIEKNDGKFEWYQDKDHFCVDIILPIK